MGQHLETRTVDEQPDIPENLSISKNFAASCVSQGFSLYSPQLEQTLFLSVEQLLVMLAFGHGRGWDDVVAQCAYLNSETEVRAWITTMVDAGFLVKPAVVEDVVGKPKLPRKREAPQGRGLRWQEIPADDRIPVYFVPHMENHYPLALGLIQSALLHHNDGALTKRFNFLPINYLDPNGIFNGPYQKFGPGIWLFSNYMWSMDINLQVSRAAKQHNAANFTIHGGPSTPDYPQASADFMRENPHVDVSIHNEGEVAIVELFAQLQMAETGRYWL